MVHVRPVRSEYSCRQRYVLLPRMVMGKEKMTPRESAQMEAEKRFDAFMVWSKRITIWAAIFLMIVVFGCNSGVETGAGKTGSGYNGDVYAPINMGDK